MAGDVKGGEGWRNFGRVLEAYYTVAQLVESLRYKPEGHGFDVRWFHWLFI